MAKARKRRSKKKTAAPKRRRRRVRAVAAPRRKRRRAKKTATKRRRRTVRVEAKRTRRRRRRAAPAAAPKRRRRRRVSAWKGNSAGHATAAKKGHRRRRARKGAPRRRHHQMGEATVAAPRRKRRRHARKSVRTNTVQSRRRHRRHRMHASRGSMGIGGLLLIGGSAGLGFVMADGLDRLLATYCPSDATRPTDKFTSDGAGTLANTLNIASMPNWKRIAAGVGVTAVPAIGSMYVKNSMGKGALEGMALGAGISAFKTFWNTVLMPLLVGKDTSTGALQKSYIARLYPSEVAAHINKKQVPSSTGVLSGAPQQTGVGDVGPFALAGDSPYPDANQALRNATGVHGDSPYPDADQSLRAQTGVHGDSPYPSTSQTLGYGGNPGQPGVGADAPWNPGPPAGNGPGPQAQPHKDCGCVGELNPYLGFVGEPPTENADSAN